MKKITLYLFIAGGTTFISLLSISPFVLLALRQNEFPWVQAIILSICCSMALAALAVIGYALWSYLPEVRFVQQLTKVAKEENIEWRLTINISFHLTWLFGLLYIIFETINETVAVVSLEILKHTFTILIGSLLIPLLYKGVMSAIDAQRSRNDEYDH